MEGPYEADVGRSLNNLMRSEWSFLVSRHMSEEVKRVIYVHEGIHDGIENRPRRPTNTRTNTHVKLNIYI